MKPPSEDPEAKRQREREKKVSEQERRTAAQRNSASMTQDYSAVYGRRSLFQQ
jgi:hypothetical protein